LAATLLDPLFPALLNGRHFQAEERCLDRISVNRRNVPGKYAGGDQRYRYCARAGRDLDGGDSIAARQFLVAEESGLAGGQKDLHLRKVVKLEFARRIGEG